MSEQFDIQEFLGMSIRPETTSITMSAESLLRIDEEFSKLRTELTRVTGLLDAAEQAIGQGKLYIKMDKPSKALECLQGYKGAPS